MNINTPLQDWEISRLSERISRDGFGRFALGDLGITKVSAFECYRSNTEHVCCQVLTKNILVSAVRKLLAR